MRRVSWLIPVTCIFHFVHQGSSQNVIGQNVARGKPAWQYPGTINDIKYGKADNAVDGNTSPDFNHASCSYTNEQSNVSAYWTVDLGVPYYISSVKIYNRDIERQRLRQFRLYGYPGNVTLYDDANQTHPQYNNPIIYVTIDSVQPYRNITVYLPTVEGEKTILTLCEVQIFREYNIAFKKPAWQYPGAHDSNFADNAVDGNTSPSYNDRSCSHTSEQSEEPAYWTVDLGDLYYIAAVKIYNRDFERQRLRQFRLYGYPGNVTLYDDANQTHPQYNMSIIYVTVDSTLQYRNITVYLPTVEGKEAILTLCEVEIYGGCLIPSIPYGNFSSETGLHHVVPSGIQMDVHCSYGYKLEIESTDFMCTINGQNYTWNNPVPVCKEITCLPLTLEYGIYTYYYNHNSAKYRNMATAKCFKGFELEGIGKRTCQENETWSGEDPLCTIITCEHPGEFDNGFYMQNNTHLYVNGSMDYNSTIQSFCERGFKLNYNQISRRTCSEHGNWTGVTPHCDPVSCDVLQNTTALSFRLYLNNSTYPGYGSMVQWMCNMDNDQKPGYQICTENGIWEGTLPICSTELSGETDCSMQGGLIGSISSNVIQFLIIAVLLGCLFFMKKKNDSLVQQSKVYMDLSVRTGTANQEMLYMDISGHQQD